MDADQLKDILTGLTTAITSMQLTQQQFFQQIQDKGKEDKKDHTNQGICLLPNFEHFDSSKENFKQYKNRFENYLKMKNVFNNKEMSKQLLINSIGATGYKSMCSIVAPDDPSNVNYDDLMTKIETHLCPKINSVVEQHRFFNLVQSEKQSIADYVSMLKSKIVDCQFSTLNSKCSFGCIDKFNDVLLRTQFIRGLQDHYIREQILKIKDVSFQAAIDEAIIQEASKEQSKELSKNKSSNLESINAINRPTGRIGSCSRPRQVKKKIMAQCQWKEINYLAVNGVKIKSDQELIFRI